MTTSWPELARPLLGQADRADLGQAEHRGRDGGVVDHVRVVVEQGLGDRPALGDRDRREVEACRSPAPPRHGRCSRRPRRCRARCSGRPDRRRSRRTRFMRTPSSSRPRPRVLGIGSRPVAYSTASRRDRPGRGVQHEAARRRARGGRPWCSCGCRARAALISSVAAARTSRSKPRSGSVAADHQRGLDAERVEDAGELDADIAAADHDQMAGPVLHVLERVVGGDGELDARQRRAGSAGRRPRPGCARRV